MQYGDNWKGKEKEERKRVRRRVEKRREKGETVRRVGTKEEEGRKKPLKMEIQVVKNIGDKKRSRNKERKKRKSKKRKRSIRTRLLNEFIRTRL